MTLQYSWYLENADLDVAEGYLFAVHETILRIAERPDLGCRRHFQAPELSRIRSIQVKKPYERHLLFYMEGNILRDRNRCGVSRNFSTPYQCGGYL